MPLRRSTAPPDPERVAWVLRASRVRRREAGRADRSGWVPADPATCDGGSAASRATPPPAGRSRAGPVEGAGGADVDGGEDVEDGLAQLDAALRRARRPSLLTVPEQLRTGRLAVSTPAVLAMIALVLALGSVFALRVLWAERAAGGGGAADPRPSVNRSAAGGAAADSASGAAAPARGGGAVPGPGSGPGSGPVTAAGRSAAPGAGGEVVVHVLGQVKRPGLVRLRPGGRVADALAAAGGTTPEADLTALNLARVLGDGEQVVVPRPGQTRSPAPQPGPGPAAAGASRARGPSGGPVSLNSADLATLDTLPGVGPVLAQRILDWRAEHGRFTSVDELGEVSGIGQKLFAQLQPKVTL